MKSNKENSMTNSYLTRYIVDEVEKVYDNSNQKYYASLNINNYTILTLLVNQKIYFNDNSHYFTVIFYHYYIYLSIFNLEVSR